MGEGSFLNPNEVLYAADMHEGLRVADFGAGSGFFTRAAARIVGDAGEVWAVDANRDLLPRIKNISLAEGLTHVEVIHGDIAVVGSSNLPQESFDAVIVANVLFMLEQPQECVAEVRRVLRPGGRVVVIDWSDSWGGLGPHPEHVLSRAKALQLFEDLHFAYVKDIPAGAYHWGFIGRKKQ